MMPDVAREEWATVNFFYLGLICQKVSILSAYVKEISSQPTFLIWILAILCIYVVFYKDLSRCFQFIKDEFSTEI